MVLDSAVVSVLKQFQDRVQRRIKKNFDKKATVATKATRGVDEFNWKAEKCLKPLTHMDVLSWSWRKKNWDLIGTGIWKESLAAESKYIW